MKDTSTQQKEQYVYSEEDLRKAFNAGINEGLAKGRPWDLGKDYLPLSFEDLLKRLSSLTQHTNSNQVK